MPTSLAPEPTPATTHHGQRQLPKSEARKLRKLMKSGYNSSLLGAAWRLADIYPLAELPRIILGRAFLQDRKTADALDQLEIVATQSDASPDVLEVYAKTLDAHGRVGDALDALIRLSRAFPEAETSPRRPKPWPAI